MYGHYEAENDERSIRSGERRQPLQLICMKRCSRCITSDGAERRVARQRGEVAAGVAVSERRQPLQLVLAQRCSGCAAREHPFQ